MSRINNVKTKENISTRRQGLIIGPIYSVGTSNIKYFGTLTKWNYKKKSFMVFVMEVNTEEVAAKRPLVLVVIDVTLLRLLMMIIIHR